ncbi:hypothetical protein COU00_02425 [Candidatus Falkowbacteria bacterium CG10_big_fil_rev_8_21_14_0_10_43_11]|uniref:HEPN domain-containing protein n=1 Tax=Candidatus Falkowbacteria bacterium CG10_big_fil_rev_8_21_14_0_10_43_11 TaxID=1974568 RepID=A0A2M6WLY0_9BACT|nr:MAG: hypothetical protein COU00_02425 [Candidatus Falkowbacteria bacterium CG10_big_fil_rev_8_21_14_0_10_43_11]
MKEKTKKWLPYIQADLQTAEASLSSRKAKSRWTNLLILWHCQQAIEKSFKAIIIEQGKELFKIHDLRTLREQAKITIEDGQLKLIADLNQYYLQSRYPDILLKGLPEPSAAVAKKLFQQTKTLTLWLTEYLKKM